MSDLPANAVGLHPEATPEPQEVRWRYVDVASPPPSGLVRPIPPSLVGVGVERIVAEEGALVVRLAAGLSWRAEGEAVRTALIDALTLGEWQIADDPVPARETSRDAELEAVTRDVLAADVGPLAAGHGGGITLRGVEGGIVTVEMAGACDGCPAAEMTLRVRLEDAIRARTDAPVEVRAANTAGAPRRRFLQWPHDRSRLRHN